MPAVKRGASKMSKGTAGKAPARMSLKKSASGGPETDAAPAPLAPPAAGSPLEIVFTFDTTGSMSGCLMEVRKKVTDIITRLVTDIPALRIAVFAHGDYCDAGTYVTKYIDFTNDVTKLTDFVNKVESTGGGDWEECYELVLRQSRELLSWTPGTQRSLVMIGDAIPHPPSDKQNKGKIDWKVETKRLKEEMGVKIYAVQADDDPNAKKFWESLASMTGGKHLKLQQFETIVDIMMGICFREQGAEFYNDFEAEVRAREGAAIRAELDRMLNTLRDGDAGPSGATAPPPPPAAAAPPPPPAAATPFNIDTVESESEEEDDPSDTDYTPGPAKRARKTTPKVKKTVAFKVKKPTTTSSKKATKKVVKKSRKEAARRLLRENVPENNFKLCPLRWTPWQPAMTTDKVDDSLDKKWQKRRGDAPGFRNTQVFKHDTKCVAVYEVGVQPRAGLKRYPVYFRTTQGFNHVSWDTYLLSNPIIKDQTNEILQKGCKLFVRRAQLPKRAKLGGQTIDNARELRSLIEKTYHYSWCRQPREVSKSGVTISREVE